MSLFPKYLVHVSIFKDMLNSQIQGFLVLLLLDLSVDAVDSSGEQQFGVEHNIFKQRLNLLGEALQAAELESINITHNKTETNLEDSASKPCYSCYGAKDGCCETCAEVREAYRQKVKKLNSYNLLILTNVIFMLLRTGLSDQRNLSSAEVKRIWQEIILFLKKAAKFMDI